MPIQVGTFSDDGEPTVVEYPTEEAIVQDGCLILFDRNQRLLGGFNTDEWAAFKVVGTSHEMGLES